MYSNEYKVPPGWTSLYHRPHLNSGVKSLAPIDEYRFLSGGYDQRVHLWTLSPDDEPESCDLKVFFKRGVDALSYIPVNRTVLGASRKQLKVFDVEKPTDRSFPMSQDVRNIHTSIDHPDVVVLEVRLQAARKFYGLNLLRWTIWMTRSAFMTDENLVSTSRLLCSLDIVPSTLNDRVADTLGVLRTNVISHAATVTEF